MSQKQDYEGLNQVSILSFQIGWEEFCIDLYDVKEIIQAGLVRKLPKSLDYIDGIYNYRGEIIHIINLNKKLELSSSELYHSRRSSSKKESKTKKKFIIILKVDSDLIGFYSDSILSIDHINPAEIIGLSPIFQTSVAMEYIKGIIKFEERPRILLNLSKIFSDVDKLRIQQDLSAST
ncbi:MAG: chemotaxis protein CheW [Promethearchaeota archaeon]